MVAWSAAAVVLLLPLVAMQVTDEVDWDLADFLFAGALLLAAGVGYELVVRRTSDRAYRAAAAVALGAAFLLVWANAAVGVIGSEDNPANLMYWGVPAVAIAGALVARLRAAGMALVMVATAAAQVLVDVIAVVSGMGFAGPVTLFFAALWLLSGWLFRKAA
jgi:hypothetical protein